VQVVQLRSLILFADRNLAILLKFTFCFIHYVKFITAGAQICRTKSGLIHTEGELNIGLVKPCSQWQRKRGHFKVETPNPL